MKGPPVTLGIETSCDETAVAVLQGETKILSDLIYSQADLHSRYGGVVPEVASRDHLRKLPYLVKDAIAEAGIGFERISLVAATRGPGLIGPLLVGFSYGKGMAYGLSVPIVGVNHLEGHIFAHRLAHPELDPPFMALIVSGGHTCLVDVEGYGNYRVVGSTVDDAAGEALDKVGKMIGIGYPAGAEIDRIAGKGDPEAIPFPRPMADSPGFDFSFAGLKTAVLYHLRKNPRERVEDVAASTLASVVEILTLKSIEATEVDFPPIRFCTDNAAMIAAAGAFRHLRLGESDPLSAVPDPRLGF